MIFVDTSVWIDFFRGATTPTVERFVALVDDDEESLDDFRRSAALYRNARRKGITLRRTLDCLIAAVCIREEVALLHADADFDRLASCSELRLA